MARGQESALKRLAKARLDREAMETRESELRREAAAELGEGLLEAGVEAIEPAKLARIIKLVVAIGGDEALKRLDRSA